MVDDAREGNRMRLRDGKENAYTPFLQDLEISLELLALVLSDWFYWFTGGQTQIIGKPSRWQRWRFVCAHLTWIIIPIFVVVGLSIGWIVGFYMGLWLGWTICLLLSIVVALPMITFIDGRLEKKGIPVESITILDEVGENVILRISAQKLFADDLCVYFTGPGSDQDSDALYRLGETFANLTCIGFDEVYIYFEFRYPIRVIKDGRKTRTSKMAFCRESNRLIPEISPSGDIQPVRISPEKVFFGMCSSVEGTEAYDDNKAF
ncbi:MAG: hypothetical protein JJU11_12295 [Candidatus Sumerlaeia bacterium]|nr:hypothetical protein [Candidatus Sumerlaeia bacterium]